ncbi:DUF5337 family protein [Nereida sp.]|uniref:DUF5337 family protein n=1 Tax=Nereida sp. TaxID=2736090 RepID=UPI003F698E5A
MNRDEKNAKQGRLAAMVIAGSGLLAILAPAIAQSLNLTIRFEILLYLFSLAGFLFALVLALQVWQSGRK